jgi:hypothetical protein
VIETIDLGEFETVGDAAKIRGGPDDWSRDKEEPEAVKEGGDGSRDRESRQI